MNSANETINKYYMLYKKDIDKTKVDFWGINIRHKEIEFKLYIKKEVDYSKNEFLQKIIKRNMVKIINDVQYKDSMTKVRYEIGLSNRNIKNMNWLHNLITQRYFFNQRQQNIINKLNELKSDIKKEVSALYFLGFISNICSPNRFETLKFHYILRTCKEGEIINRDYYINKNKIFRILKEADEIHFGILIDIIGPLLESELGELWIAAVDVCAVHKEKFKIYIKTKENIEPVVCKLKKNPKTAFLKEQLDAYLLWIKASKKFISYGFAVCIDSDKKLSVNFYNKLR